MGSVGDYSDIVQNSRVGVNAQVLLACIGNSTFNNIVMIICI